MTWTDYKVPTIDIDTGDGKLRPIRGLALEDFSILVSAHLDDMMEIATLYVQSQKDVLAGTNMTDIVMLVSRQFPKVISEVISMVTDTPELKELRLPVGLQIKIIQTSIKLTLEDAGGLGNLTATFQSVVDAAVEGRGEVSRKLQDTLSQSSIGGAAKTPAS